MIFKSYLVFLIIILILILIFLRIEFCSIYLFKMMILVIYYQNPQKKLNIT